ncbi:radical SAM protein [Candidatus Pacearchaeota archaeon]|nr:radical SAM protein [Candidatus Pacearchaeota archaeon]
MTLKKSRKFNYGALKERLDLVKNIVYYKRGLEELSLNVTNACPNACVFCIRDRDSGWGVANLYLNKDPSVEEIISAFDEESKRVKNLGINLKRVKICGYGEPLLRFKDLIFVISHIRKSEPNTEIQIATTGWPYFRFISEKETFLKKAMENGLTHIFLSLNASDKVSYKKLVRPGIKDYDENAFEDTLRFGVMAKKLGLDVVLGFIDLDSLDKKKAKILAESNGLKYKIREFENGESK